ncbi:MAG TPA: hypothetical protein VJ735_03440 [Actinomycetes bacterium]|nr:hypothetical protein [Actinomycetes bacterium]
MTVLGSAECLGGSQEIQYRRATMRVHRQAQATAALVVLAVLFGSLWACALGASGPGTPVDQLIASRSRLGLEAATLPDRAAALRPSSERPDPAGRLLLPLLLGLVGASITIANRVPARRRHSSRTSAQSPVLATPRGPRAPPCLQPG